MTALRRFKQDTGRFPSTEEGLQALIVQPTSVENWKGPYMKDGLPKDPWGNPYIYREPGTLNADGVDVLSFGPDLRDGGGDDIFGR
jgi:general secretion pathway protein G